MCNHVDIGVGYISVQFHRVEFGGAQRVILNIDRFRYCYMAEQYTEETQRFSRVHTVPCVSIHDLEEN